jgi:hypothetical protein
VVDDEARFVAQLREVVALNEGAAALAATGVRVVSCDEKTGMQAVERLGKLQMARGRPERVESWYRRHGTLCLTANLDLATGKVVAPTLQRTRTNADFVEHVAQTIATDPDARWIFVVDNLDTHRSEELVRWVAAACGELGDLGKKWKSGSLRNRASRAAFLTDPARRIRFAYTPKHCSWLNEVERWFSKLARSLLRRGSFKSREDLAAQVRAYIAYYNTVNARPHRWNAKADDLLRKMRIGT